MTTRSTRRVPRPGAALLAAAVIAGWGAPAAAGQLDSATYFALQRGMSESELLVRAGPPDLITRPGGEVIVQRDIAVIEPDPRLALIGETERVREIEIRQYHYVPDHREHDPHLTVVTLRAGRIWEIERTKLLTRPPAPAGEAAAVESSPPRLTDHDVRVQRADRVLSAAEAYAATRARLKDRAAAEAAGGTPESAPSAGLYRDTGDDGVPYFGDRPPAAE